MKILYLHQYFVTPEMAGGTRSYEMARRLVREGHEVHVLTTRQENVVAQGPRWTVTREAGIHVHWICVPYNNRMGYLRRIWAFFSFALYCARRAVEVGGDLVLASSTPLTIGIPGIFAAKRLKVPFVFEVRDLWPDAAIAIGALRNPLLQFLARRLETFCYSHAARIIALSPGMKQGVVKTGYPEARVAVVPNSCDRELFVTSKIEKRAFRREHAWLGHRPLVVYTGTLGAANDVPFVVEIARLARTQFPEVRFLVVGDGKEENKVRELASRYGVLNQNLFLWKPLPKRKLPALLGAADLSLTVFRNLPILRTCSPNKFFDALAAGVPVAVNTPGWLEELVKKEQLGIFLPPDDAAEACRRIGNFLADNPAREKAQRQTLRAAHLMFDRDKLFQEFYRTVLAAHAEQPQRQPTAPRRTA